MPVVNGKKFPYTEKGMADAKKAAKKKPAVKITGTATTTVKKKSPGVTVSKKAIETMMSMPSRKVSKPKPLPRKEFREFAPMPERPRAPKTGMTTPVPMPTRIPGKAARPGTTPVPMPTRMPSEIGSRRGGTTPVPMPTGMPRKKKPIMPSKKFMSR